MLDSLRIDQQFSRDPKVERSLRRGILDGVTFAAMGGLAENYFSAFALLLKASTAQIGLLASLPPLLATLTQLLSVWFGARTRHRRRIIVAGALLQALTLVPLVLLPWLFPDDPVDALLVLAVLYFIGPNIGAPMWGSLMGDLVPEERRGRYFALRTRLASLSGFVALIGAGTVLHLFQTVGAAYWGFVTIFSLACAMRLVSAWHLAHLLDPPRVVVRQPMPISRDLWQRLRRSELVPFSLFFACMQFSVAISGPYFALYMLRDLQYSYFEFMLNSAVTICFQFLTLNRWGRISDLFGNRLVLRTTGMLIPLLPLSWLVSTNFWYLLFVQAASGLVWAGFTLSASNSVFELTPADRRATLMAYHSVLAAVAVFAGASIGGWLGTHLPTEVTLGGTTWSWLTPLYGGMVLSALLRVATNLVFLPRLKEHRKVRRMSMTGVIFRVTRFNPIAGLSFDLVDSFRRRRDEPPD